MYVCKYIYTYKILCKVFTVNTYNYRLICTSLTRIVFNIITLAK